MVQLVSTVTKDCVWPTHLSYLAEMISKQITSSCHRNCVFLFTKTTFSYQPIDIAVTLLIIIKTIRYEYYVEY